MNLMMRSSKEKRGRIQRKEMEKKRRRRKSKIFNLRAIDTN
jgi:hypothetical protein